MQIYLASTRNYAQIIERAKQDPLLYQNGKFTFYKLDSFYGLNGTTRQNIHNYKNFMLDSGAFSFMSGAATAGIDIDKFCDGYIRCINENRVKLFIELDVDSVFGYQKVLELRRKIERGTGRQCIPVWHKSRGKQAFIDMCREYPYVALGGFVIREIVPKDYKYVPWFIDTAHEHGAKIHGLGFTRASTMSWLHFDSVDSAAWIVGRYGHSCHFNGRKMIVVSRDARFKGQDKRLRDRAGLDYHNFKEWVKFSHYAETHF